MLTHIFLVLAIAWIFTQICTPGPQNLENPMLPHPNQHFQQRVLRDTIIATNNLINYNSAN